MQDLVQYKDTNLLVPARLADKPGINVSASGYPFTAGMKQYVAKEGLSCAEILTNITKHPSLALAAHVYVNETYIPKQYWHRVHPKEGTTLTIKVIPGKGGKKNPLATILSIAVIAAAAWAGPALVGALGVTAGTTTATIVGALGSAVVNAVGSLLINAIAPPAKQRATGATATGNTTDSATLFIEGARNVPDYYGVVPIVFGRHLVVPKLAANNYTETVGTDQFVRQLFALGLGKYNVYNPRIGATSLDEFTDVEINQYIGGEGSDAVLELYPESVFQEDLGIQLLFSTGWIVRTTQPAADEFIIDVTCPKGMVFYNTQGKKVTTSVQLEIQYGVTGSGIWSVSQFINISNATTAALRETLRVISGGGQYDVRMRRNTADASNDQLFNETWWTGLKTVTHENPVAMKGLSMVETRIKATDQLNGAVDQFQEELFSVLPDWDSATSTWIERETRNPASFFRFVCQNSDLFEDGGGNPLVDAPNARPLADTRIMLEDIEEFHEHCVLNGFEYNAVIDFETSVWDMLSEIAASGRAAPTLVDGKWSVVIDREQTTIAQHFTAANTWGYSAVKVFPEVPHALRVQFINEESGYLQDERLVYDDGYTKANARKIEGLQLPGITKPSLIWKHGREHLAVIRLRPIEHTFYCDVEHLVATRGRLIKFAHDVPLVGVAQGYITEVVDDGGSPANVTSIKLDRIVPMENLKVYSIRVRNSKTGATIYKTVNTIVGDQSELFFTTPFPVTEGMEIDQLFMFGETGKETIDLIVKDIYPDNDFVAKIVCVDASPAIFQASTGTIPDFVSNVSIPASMLRPLAPIIRNIQTGAEVQVRNADGSISSRMVITLENPNGFDVIPGVKMRNSDASAFTDATVVFANATQVIIDGLDQDVRYDLQIIYKKLAYADVGGLGGTAYSPPAIANLIRFDGISDNPPNVENLRIQLLGDIVLLNWNAVSLIDFDRYEVRYSPNVTGVSWYTAQPVVNEADRLSINSVTLAAATGTFMVKAFDTGGRESALEATISLTVVNEGFNAVATVIEEPDFLGTHTNTLVTIDDNLELDDLTIGTGEYEFDDIIDLSEVYPCKVVPHIVAGGRNSGNTMNLWPNLNLLTSLSGTDPSSWSVQLLESHTDDDPLGSPTWTPWTGIILGSYTFRAMKFKIILTGNGTNVTPSIEELRVTIDMPDRIEKDDDLTVTAGGVSVLYDPAFKAKPALVWSLINGVAGDKVEVTSESATGFSIKVTNGGVDVTRHVAWHSLGYGRVQ